MDTGDFVIVVNAAKVALTGAKLENMPEPTPTQTPEEGTSPPEEEAGEHVSEYTTETAPESARRAAARPVVTGTALGTGRRKEAIARVRIAPGTGQWQINGRSLEAF